MLRIRSSCLRILCDHDFSRAELVSWDCVAFLLEFRAHTAGSVGSTHQLELLSL